jgi:hypothetical protein
LAPYEKFIEGDYYQNNQLALTDKKRTEKKRDLVNALRKGYPNALSADEFAAYGIKVNTAHQYLWPLFKSNIIRYKRGISKKGRDVDKFYFEDYNFILNSKEGYIFPFAPGYVQYTSDFIKTYNNIRNKEFEDEVHNKLMDFLIDALGKKKIKPNVHRSDVGCGYDHEARDFIRATLLRLIDGLELNRRYINFIGEELKIIDEIRHKELMRDSQSWSKSDEIPHDRGVPIKLRLVDIRKFLDGLPAQIHFMGEQCLVKVEHDLQEIVLDHIIKKYPEKIKEIQDEIGDKFISRNKLYSKHRGSRKISNGYYMEIKSPRDRMIRNCDRILKMVGLGRLTAVLTLNYQK